MSNNNGAIDFRRTFGEGSNSKPEQARAQFWLNLGYTSDVKDEQGVNKFVSLPLGIPLDTQEHVSTSSKNQDFAKFQSARNGLFDQVMAVAAGLKPGESRIIKLEVQLRRVSADTVADIPAETNQFARVVEL